MKNNSRIALFTIFFLAAAGYNANILYCGTEPQVKPLYQNFLISQDLETAVKIICADEQIADCPFCGHNHLERLKIFFTEYYNTRSEDPPAGKKYWIAIMVPTDPALKTKIILSKKPEKFSGDMDYGKSDFYSVELECSASKNNKIIFSHIVIDTINAIKINSGKNDAGTKE